jgi:acyl transferase domain-containing protein/acyl carrier protein
MTADLGSVAGIRDWITAWIAARAGLAGPEVSADERFSSYGIDSAASVALLAELGAALGRKLSPLLPWEHPTAGSLAAWLASGSGRPAAVQEASGIAGQEPIAIIGLAGRFPRADDARAFWQLLREGGDAIAAIPDGRSGVEAFYERAASTAAAVDVCRGGFLDRIDGFDPSFFGISPREAAEMDPQQRLMLELSWAALEDAGVPAPALAGSRTGVFFGAWQNDYAQLPRGARAAAGQHAATGQDLGIIANRVSYFLGVRGPSLVALTACSSALVAVHLACQSLRSGESSLALAGGVHLVLSPELTLKLARLGILAPDARCRPFSARPQGFVRGEGAGVVVLKPLSRAVADGDPVYCLVRGSAVNNDGFSQGLTAPSPAAQEEVLRQAYGAAGVAPRTVHYLEAHGTGTALGDLTEANALGSVLGAGREPGRPLLVGSVKGNIGHLESAAGIAGLIKVALSMRHGSIPPSLHCDDPNPEIAFAELNLRVASAASEWPEPEKPPLAGVSAFGFGGTNAHVVVQGWGPRPARLLPLSAPSRRRLRRAARDLRSLAAAQPAMAGLRELCAAAAHGATGEAHRLALVVRSRSELLARLDHFLLGELDAAPPPGDSVAAGEPRRVFVFSGQGSEWSGMAQDLLSREPVFRHALRRCDESIRALVGWSVVDVVAAGAASSRLRQIEVSWPTLFAVQVALAALWGSWGIAPDAVLGHSIGEVAAAHVAGVLGLEAAALVICHQARVMTRIEGRGAMLLAGLGWHEVEALLGEREALVGRAVDSGPGSAVLSGDAAALQELAASLEGRGVACRWIQTATAAHSPQVEALMDELRGGLSELQPGPATMPLMSGLLGGAVRGEVCGADHWARVLREPVLLRQAIDDLAGEARTVFLEISPHPIVGKSIAETLARHPRGGVALASLRRHEDAHGTLLAALARLYEQGAEVRWERLQPRPAGLEAARAEDAPLEVLVLSAHTVDSLRELARATAAMVGDGSPPSLQDLCYSAAVRRAHLEHRLAATARTRRELADRLGAFAGGESPAGVSSGRRRPGPRRLAFAFCGQGTQWRGMGQALYAREAVFRAALDRCEALFRAAAGWSLLAQMWADEGSSRIEATEVAQPAIFALQVAQAALWRAWGVVPDAVVGHSMGEVAAAHVAGVLSLEDAIAVIYHRGRLMAEIAGRGRMAAVALSEEEARREAAGAGGLLAVAAINGARSTVLSGDPLALTAVLGRLRERGVHCRLLSMDYAFHSPQVQPCVAALGAALRAISTRPAQLPILSTVTGRMAESTAFDAAYWSENVEQPVRFSAALDQLAAADHEIFVELGPHPVLSPLIEHHLGSRGQPVRVIPSARRHRDERATLLESLGLLYTGGCQVAWERVYPSGRCVQLPPLPWNRGRHWFEDSPTGPSEAGDPGQAGDAGQARDAGQAGDAGQARDAGSPRDPAPSFDPSAPDPASDWLYAIEWAAAPPPGGRREGAAAGCWLILGDGAGVGAALAGLLRGRGESAVLMGGPLTTRRLRQALADLAGTGSRPPCRGILCLWELDPGPDQDDADAGAVAERARRRCNRLLGLTRAVTAVAWLPPAPKLWWVTRGAQAIAGDGVPPLAVTQALAWGLGRVIALEHPEIWGGLVDLDADPAPPTVEADQLLAELLAPDGEDQVAHRHRRRHVARLTRQRGASAAPYRCRPDASYLISGGLGGIGRRLAVWLAERGAKQLVLLGRGGGGDGTPALLEELTAKGARVRLVRADVASESDVSSVLADVQATLPPLGGVFHLAGQWASQPVADATAGTDRRVLRAKVGGAWILHRLTRELPLDCFVMFSSAAATWGGTGMAYYAAANQFLDALAHHRRGLGLPALSVNWGRWPGPGIASAEAHLQWSQSGMRPLAPQPALSILGWLMTSGAAQMTVAAVDWSVLKPAFEARRRRPLLARIAAGPQSAFPGHGETSAGPGDEPAAARLQRWRREPPARRLGLMLETVRAAAGKILGESHPQGIDPRRGLFEMGMDSLMSVQLRNRLQAELQCSLPSTLTFDHPTVAAIATYLVDHLVQTAPAADLGPSTPPAGQPGPERDADLSTPELAAMLAERLQVYEAEEAG